ncbi:neutral ceramidase precursor [Pseudovirgaria hyperparasitica]|uniref:Neutral ceramidase n=1 Tax=Pseudovirgaria hyperparasitica TaxID=470096 RepID=A0A6A6WJC7_9PEZI|nr:neutral ceramidase precursor [Pseudovirgaria hyperparasitica]KAF2762519.1 neutral ceramidase precursor [Pseudovirgaria hyperparasitica]
MARTHFIAALAASCLALLVIVQLASTRGLPEVDYWHWQDEGATERGSTYSRVQSFIFGDKHEEMVRQAAGSEYMIGVGKADITGPVVELNLMGYANTSQIGSGLRQRIYSRAFIVGDPDNTAQRIVYLVLDTQSGDTAIRDGILKGVAALGPQYSVYNRQNIAVTGTHSHSGPAAWLNYLLPTITSKGFDKQSYQAIVDGAVLSIKRAHESLTKGRLSVGTGQVKDSAINRSLYAYMANPSAERARYADNVDKTMTLVKFTRDSDGKDVGVLTWFPVHGTSLLGNNSIVAGDNKGVAAYLFEKDMQSNSNAAEGFVAGFSQANVGDTTPNVNGAWCEDGSNQECTYENSTCGGTSQACHGRGPFFGLNDAGAKSCFEIGTRQFTGAKGIYGGSLTPVSGTGIRSFHTYNDMRNYTFAHPNGTIVKTCAAALGYSFAAGTSDGPGAFDFTQGDDGEPSASPLWEVVKAVIKEPGPEQKACQGEKPILLDVGEIHIPYEWTPNIVDIQMMRVGQLLIIVSPGEATTMSGRRWKEAIAKASTDIVPSGSDPVVVLGGPANSYTHYIATEEEYNIQRYEGASTLYGPHTLNAYINLTSTFLPYLSDSSTSAPPGGPDPPINTDRALSFITGVVFDAAGGKSFGQVITDVQSLYSKGSAVKVTFQGANPRNNLRLENTFAAIEKQSGSTWTRVRDDQDWELIYEWKRTNEALGFSEVTITWETNSATDAGKYRVKYYGDSKPLFGSISAFEGTSGEFTIS